MPRTRRYVIYSSKERSFADRFVDPESNITIGRGTKIEPGAIIYDNCSIGENCIVGTSAVLKPETHVGDNSIFGTLSITEGHVKIGSWTTINSQCHLTWGMEVGNNVYMAPLFYSANTPKISLGKFGYPNTTHDPKKFPIIKDGVRMGENVGLAPGVVIGEDSLIDMCCLITKDIPKGSHVRADKSVVGKIIGTVY